MQVNNYANSFPKLNPQQLLNDVTKYDSVKAKVISKKFVTTLLNNQEKIYVNTKSLANKVVKQTERQVTINSKDPYQVYIHKTKVETVRDALKEINKDKQPHPVDQVLEKLTQALKDISFKSREEYNKMMEDKLINLGDVVGIPFVAEKKVKGTDYQELNGPEDWSVEGTDSIISEEEESQHVDRKE